VGFLVDLAAGRERAFIRRAACPFSAFRSRSEAALKPLPTLPAYCSLPSVVSTQQQRAETAARALRIGIAADDEFLPLAAFEFDPRAGCGATVAHRGACR
jgi:hypothetical protein